jgi:hypothetical protein
LTDEQFVRAARAVSVKSPFCPCQLSEDDCVQAASRFSAYVDPTAALKPINEEWVLREQQALTNRESPALIATLLVLLVALLLGRDGVLALGAVVLLASVSLRRVEKARALKTTS